jgi:hypothetical protein
MAIHFMFKFEVLMGISKILVFIFLLSYVDKGHAVVRWLRHSATNRKAAGSIPDGVIGIFH